MIGPDGELYCDWCDGPVAEDEAWLIQWSKPGATAPYLGLDNIICDGCKASMHAAVAEVEQARRVSIDT